MKRRRGGGIYEWQQDLCEYLYGVRGYQARSGGEREVDVPDVDSSG